MSAIRKRGIKYTPLAKFKQSNSLRYSSASNILVIYNTLDATGTAAALYYQSRRSIPAVNMLPVTLTWSEVTNGTSMTAADCDTNLLPQVVSKLNALNITSIVTCGRWPVTVVSMSMFTVLGAALKVALLPQGSRYSSESTGYSFNNFQSTDYPTHSIKSPSYICAGGGLNTASVLGQPLEVIPPVDYLHRTGNNIIPHFRLEVSSTGPTDTRIPNPSDLNFIKRIIDDGIDAENAKYTDLGTVLLSASGSYTSNTTNSSITGTLIQGQRTVTGISSTVGIRPGIVMDTSGSYGYVTTGSNIMTSVSSTEGLAIGKVITCTSFPVGTTVVSFDASTITMSNNSTTTSIGFGVSFTFYINTPGTTVSSIDSPTQITLSTNALVTATTTINYARIYFGSALMMGAPTYIEIDGLAIKPAHLYTYNLHMDIEAVSHRNTTYGRGLYVDRSSRYMYICTATGTTNTSSKTLYNNKGVQSDGTAVFIPYAPMAQDVYPFGSTDIENLGGESGKVFVPISDVFFRSMGVNSYYVNNRQPDTAAQFTYRKGAIAIFTQSFSFIPTPINDYDWEFTPITLIPGTIVTIPTINSSCNLPSRNLINKSINIACIYSTNTLPTMQIVNSSTIVLKESGVDILTISWTGSTYTSKQIYEYIKGLLPTGWFIATRSGQTSSRAMTAIKNGACFTYGSWTEPYTSGASKTSSLLYNLSVGLSTGEAMFTIMQSMHYYYTLIVGDPLYRPFGHLRK